MTSKQRFQHNDEAYVWVWLPKATQPIVAGRLAKYGDRYQFNYGSSYLENPAALPLNPRELPLRKGVLDLTTGLNMPGTIRDGAPDAWGRRVIMNRLLGSAARQQDTATFDELTYLLASASDRIGALDFQLSPTEYIARAEQNASLEELLEAAERVEQGRPLAPDLAAAIFHGTAIGGARPKALIQSNDRKYVAKFSSSTDLYSVVKAEFVAMRLAEHVGLTVAPVKLECAAGRDVLLVERFDRECTAAGWLRKPMVSALTLLELDELMARYASYEHLAEIIRLEFAEPEANLRELFSRLVFNILCGNTDDHARNHAALLFRNGDSEEFTLAPAYDICPQARAGNEASQGMLITGNDRSSRLATCIRSAHVYLLSQTEAEGIVEKQLEVIHKQWQSVCDVAQLSELDRQLLWRRQFLNPSIFEVN
ncbi:type II toxin-antitoxin system HipA family toxin [Pseudidiomarina aestuarii]|uniref:type II toxin-antitoxin system HipA family toxin n=1 Tax=Pseudidiomarina aestuarii TaxID=624146 RepID=UPI003A980358